MTYYKRVIDDRAPRGFYIATDCPVEQARLEAFHPDLAWLPPSEGTKIWNDLMKEGMDPDEAAKKAEAYELSASASDE